MTSLRERLAHAWTHLHHIWAADSEPLQPIEILIERIERLERNRVVMFPPNRRDPKDLHMSKVARKLMEQAGIKWVSESTVVTVLSTGIELAIRYPEWARAVSNQWQTAFQTDNPDVADQGDDAFLSLVEAAIWYA